MKVETWPIDKPIPYSRNPRNNEAAVSKVAGSIKEFGWRQPIVVDSEGVIIAGHTRLLAAQHLRLKEVPVHVATDLTPQQIKAYRLADNRVGQEAEWDNDLLKLELSELEDDGFDLDLTGFDEDELDALLAEEDERQLDEEKYTTKIETPIYEIKGERPEISELYDNSKMGSLCEQIQKADLPNEVREFLLAAATRHTVFNYEKIAEFYAHQEPETRELMEQSALVIIDYNKAIEEGYVRLTAALMGLSAESDNV